ncbi:hypothetical protein F2Q70_00024825 [Brassica cretica]|uniref:Uncharacterized protein n=1 Tax=Brassica cretica TaxID=69181 RepID=A0A8S9LDC4_BRACR|nr:hypothetical protein F2Q70_00024825 [Brassica cretica]
MPARSHSGEARSISPSGYSLVLCFVTDEQEALWSPPLYMSVQEADSTFRRRSPSSVYRFSYHRLYPLLSSPCLSSLLDVSGRDGSVMALGAMDLLLDADCARIWVRSEIRDPPEASTCHDRPRLCSAVSPQSIYFSG